MSPAKKRLPPKRRKALALGLATIIDSIDLPDFVAALLDGTFQTLVDGTRRQMEAYSQLVRAVASSVEAFSKDKVSAETARNHLVQKYGPFLGGKWSPQGKRPSAKKKPARHLARSRQQLLATMLLMGINRIVVTDGQINARLTKEPARRRRRSPR